MYISRWHLASFCVRTGPAVARSGRRARTTAGCRFGATRGEVLYWSEHVTKIRDVLDTESCCHLPMPGPVRQTRLFTGDKRVLDMDWELE
jgi:hypothetical protein